MKYVDIHSHLDFFAEGEEMNMVLARMIENDLATITVGASLERSKKAVKIAEVNENVWATIGVHPDEKMKWQDAEKEFKELVENPKVVAIGECGLDYFGQSNGVSEEKKQKQKILFEEQIKFAIKFDKPLMLHVRASSRGGSDAYEDSLDILEKYKKEFGNKLKGNVHCFVGSTEIAKRFLDLDFTTSFIGVITFAHDYDEVVKYIPQNMIMSETDAPWVAPVPHRGEKNEPSYVISVIKKMAEIRGEKFEDLNNAIIENFKRCFLG